MAESPTTVERIRGSVAVTDETKRLDAVPVEDRRAAITGWKEANPDVIPRVLSNLGRIASNEDPAGARDAVAAAKVLLDHVEGRAPEAREAAPQQTLVIVRGGE